MDGSVDMVDHDGEARAEVASAIAAVMKKIGTLGRDASNQHANYNYASTDVFFKVVGPLMADVGLVLIAHEVAWEIRDIANKSGGVRSLLFITYEFHWIHSGGASLNAGRRTVNVDAGGAQQWGQAQSYAIKQFLRASFLIPTGEPDADSEAPFTMESAPQAPPKVRARKGKAAAGSVEGDSNGGAEVVADTAVAGAETHAQAVARSLAAFVADLGTAATKEEIDTKLRTLRAGPGNYFDADQKQQAVDAYSKRLGELNA